MLKRHLPQMNREPGQIDQRLRKRFRDAAKGLVRWPLFISGEPGTGKTCAGLSLADHVLNAEWWAWEGFWRFVQDVNMGRAVTTLAGRWNEDGGYRELSTVIHWTPYKWWSYVASLPLVILDDVGLRGQANDTQYEALKAVLDRRDGLPLIVTSNLDLPKLGIVFDLRVMDRLGCGTTVHLDGKSRR